MGSIPAQGTEIPYAAQCGQKIKEKKRGKARKGLEKQRENRGNLNQVRILVNNDFLLSKLWEMVKDREAGVLESMGSQRARYDLASEQQHKHCIKLINLGDIKNEYMFHL